MRKCAFSDLTDPAGGTTRINNIGITHSFSPETSGYDARRRAFALLVTAEAVRKDCERYVAQ